MPQVPIPQEYVAPMDEIADGVMGLRLAFVNLFAVTNPNGSWTLIDAGLPFTASYIASWAEKNFHVAPTAILLTHGHFDHVSAAGELADKWNTHIYAHPQELPYLNGQREYPPPNFAAGGGLMSLLSPLYPKGPVQLGERLRPLPMEETAVSRNALPGWIFVHTPGHTPGHVAFFRPSDRLLIAGDAFCTTKPESFFDAALTQPPELHGPPAYFTPDWDSASRSIQHLAGLNPLVIAPGHGKPLSGAGVAGRLHRLAEQFANGGDAERAA